MTLAQHSPLTRGGLPGIEHIPFGTHACHFYRDRDQLVAALVPFFVAGLRANECCLWVAAPPLPAREATALLRVAHAGVDDAIRAGALRILDFDEWYGKSGQLKGLDVVPFWLEEEERALAEGYDGLRINGNTSFLKPDDWPTFMQYEQALTERLQGRRIVALCSYSLEQCNDQQVGEIMDAHPCTFKHPDVNWHVIAASGDQEITRRKSSERALTETQAHCVFSSTRPDGLDMFFDISEPKRAEETSRRVEREFRDFVENASVAMHWVGPDGIILWANRAELDMLGFAAEEYIGHHIAEFHADKAAIQAILQRLTNRETLRNCEVTLRCKDGTVRHALISSNVLWDGDKFIHTRCITRDITERVQSQAQITILGREAEHRAKNVLATVQAAIELTQADTAEGFKRAIKGRVRALANAHNLFVQSSWTGAELRDLVAQELSPYCRDGETRARIEGANVLLEPTTAQTIAVCVHELTTNAAKYGALSLPEGRVHIEWSRAADGRLVVRWTETNGPPVKQPTRRGFGMRAIETIIRGPLNGDVRFDWRAEGLACEIELMTS